MVALTLESTTTQAMPAGTRHTVTTTGWRTNATTSIAPPNTTPARNSSRLGDRRARTRGITRAPAIAPMPSAASRMPYPLAPIPSRWFATSGSSAHSALPGTMNSAARSRIRRTIEECRTYRPPARTAAANRSGAPPSSPTGRRQRSSTTMNTTNDSALRAKTAATPVCAMSTPAIAGPIARATFMLIAPSADADGSCARGTSSGITACHAGSVSA